MKYLEITKEYVLKNQELLLIISENLLKQMVDNQGF